MEESTKTDVSSRRVKRLQSDTSLNKSSSKSGEESVQVISNGTGSSSTENLVEEESSSRATKGPIKISKISKNSKTEPSKEAIKSPNKALLSPVKATSPSGSPSSSSLSKDGFQGFEDTNSDEKEGERRKEFLSFVENLKSEEWVEPEDEASERGEEEEEMTLDAGQTSDTDSNQMEIDTGSDKAQDKTRDSDVDALEMDVMKEEQPTKNGVSGNGNNTRSKGGGATVEYYCGACEAEVNDSEEAICCDGTCERWFHLRCSGLSQSEYTELGLDENAKWACSKCSGNPTPVTPAVTKPLLSVRKDLAKPIITPVSTKRKSVAKEGSAARGARVDISNPAFLKPFDFGWKRELVYRSTNDNTPSNKRHGDIYYYTPKGKKLRSLREILDHLAGTDLTQDNFTFHKEPIGLDDPDKEIIRDAKLKMTMKDPLSTPSPVVIKKATPKITKAPKQATPKVVPKLTATVSPLETGGTTVPKASASVTPRVVFKGKASMGGTVRTKTTPKTQASTSQAQKDKKKKTSDDDLEMGMLPPMWEPVPKQKESKLGTDVCSIRCLPAMGLIPTLQCVVCLCLYHPQCVGLSEEPSHDYKCKNCLLEKSKPANSSNGNKTLHLPPPLLPITTLSSSTSVSHSVPSPPKLQRMSEGKQLNPRFKPPVTKATSLVGGVTTWLPPSSTVHMRGQTPISKFSPSQKPLPPTDTETKSNQPVQSLVNMNGKKYIYITKHNVLSVSPATTSGVPSDHVSTQVTTTAFDTNTTLATQAYGSPILPKSQASPAATFIVGSPTSSTGNFQKPPGVLLVPYMAPQTSHSQMDGQQPQYIVVNGPTMTPGNIIIGNIPQQQQVPQPPESALE